MVAHLISLRLRLTIAGWKRSTMVLILSLFGIVYALGVLLVAIIGMFALGSAHPDTRGTIIVLLGTLVVLAWLIVPVFVSGMDQAMEPGNFATFGIKTTTLVVGLGLGALATTTGALTLLGSLATTLAWLDDALATVVALVGALLATAFCICLAHGVTGLLSSFTGQRRVRETISLIAFIPLMLAGVAIGTIFETITELFELLPTVAAVLSWTPFGTFFGAAWSVAHGQSLIGLTQVGLSVLWVVLAGWLWMFAVRRSVDLPSSSGKSARSAKGVGVLDVVPATPAGAIMARSLIYWVKDPRYSASLVTLPLMVVVLWFAGAQFDSGGLSLMLGPIFGLLLAFSVQADLSYDGSALSMHVTAGVSGRDDRRGRIAALLIWASPVTLIVCVFSAWMADAWHLLGTLIGGSFAMLLGGTGLSAVVSARFVYPVPAPGASPFATPQGSMGRTVVIQAVSMLAILAIVLPTLVIGIISLVAQTTLWDVMTLIVGLLNGLALLFIGSRIGARWYDRTQDLTYQQVLKYVSSQ